MAIWLDQLDLTRKYKKNKLREIEAVRIPPKIVQNRNAEMKSGSENLSSCAVYIMDNMWDKNLFINFVFHLPQLQRLWCFCIMKLKEQIICVYNVM